MCRYHDGRQLADRLLTAEHGSYCSLLPRKLEPTVKALLKREIMTLSKFHRQTQVTTVSRQSLYIKNDNDHGCESTFFLFLCLQTFKPGDTKKSLTITLIHHEGYMQEKDLYVLLKNPTGKAELGEPNLTRITIIDDDGND